MRISNPEHENVEELTLLFQRLRGAAVSSFAEAEFAMGDLMGAMESANCEPNVAFSQQVERRLTAFKRACLFHADDADLRERVKWATSNFEAVIQDRNAFVHGSAKLFPEERKVEMLKLSPKKGRNHSVQCFVYDLNSLDDRVRHFELICTNIIALSWLLADKLGLQRDLEPGFRVAFTSYE